MFQQRTAGRPRVWGAAALLGAMTLAVSLVARSGSSERGSEVSAAMSRVAEAMFAGFPEDMLAAMNVSADPW